MPNKKDLHCLSRIKDTNTFILKSENLINLSSKQKYLSKELNNTCTNGFSSLANHNFLKKLKTCELQQLKVPVQMYAHKAEVEPVPVEGIGWAGQTIARRTHPILPEVYGDNSDVFTGVEKLPGSTKAHKEKLSFTQSNVDSEILSGKAQLQAVNLEGKEESIQNHQYIKDDLVNTIKTTEGTEVENPPKSPNVMSVMHENITSVSLKRLPSKEADLGSDTVKGSGGVQKNTEEQVVTKVGHNTLKKYRLLKKMKDTRLSQVPVKLKMKAKKGTKIYSSKSNLSQPSVMTKTKIKNGKKKNVKINGVGKKIYAQPNILLNQQISAQPVRKSLTISSMRQIQTYSHANLAKVSIKVTEKTSETIVAFAKKQVKRSKPISEGKYTEDCKCPETLETELRFPTKICGEAAGAQDKKKKMKEWKGKMCPVERKMKYRRRTFVCKSAMFSKAKGKRQLPKCVKPEKKIAPRVLVCPPVLEETLLKQQQKKCVKQVEEVKVRSQTKVCKPVIIYQKEETMVVVQKPVCTEKKVKKTISRYTKVCPPSEQSGSKQKSKR